MDLCHHLYQKQIRLSSDFVTGDSLLKIAPEKFKRIVKVTPPIKTKPYYLMLSHQFVKKHPQLAEKIWDTIEIIRESQFDRISAKYSN